MKPFLHPFKQNTTIQRKDGSTFRRNWTYLRSGTIRLEGDSKAWRQLNTRDAIDYSANKEVLTAPLTRLNLTSGSTFRRRRERGLGRTSSIRLIY